MKSRRPRPFLPFKSGYALAFRKTQTADRRDPVRAIRLDLDFGYFRGGLQDGVQGGGKRSKAKVQHLCLALFLITRFKHAGP
jgi:hypothetical protein